MSTDQWKYFFQETKATICDVSKKVVEIFTVIVALCMSLVFYALGLLVFSGFWYVIIHFIVKFW